MRIYIVIPAHNEEAYLSKMLQSLVEQSILPEKIVLVNDNSTDNSQSIINSFSENYYFIKSVSTSTEKSHEPGSKVINAFYKGFEMLDDEFDVICKFDADLIFPKNYLETIAAIFKNNPTCGIAGGFCFIEKNNEWILENLTNTDHIRGALKAYRKDCFKQIGGLKKTMGWDTVDELLAQYHGWKVITNESLHVKHLKPTGILYSNTSKYKQGEAFYKMRYGFILTKIAAAKLSFKKRNFRFFIDTIIGYIKASKQNLPFIVSEEEGKFIRNLRWKGIKNKLF
jgi:glycosyltransferase involved in cell wall biosynthesis